MSAEAYVVWHGATWRSFPPPSIGRGVRVLPIEERQRLGLVAPPTIQQQVLDAITDSWQMPGLIRASLPAHIKSASVAMVLTRLWRRGVVERDYVGVGRMGRPSYRYRRRRTEAAA